MFNILDFMRSFASTVFRVFTRNMFVEKENYDCDYRCYYEILQDKILWKAQIVCYLNEMKISFENKCLIIKKLR